MDFSIEQVKAEITKLFNAGVEFDKAKARLAKLAPVAAQNPTLKARYDDIMARGGGMKAAISGALQKVQDVYAWIKSQFGINLGAIPLVPIAILGGITAASAAALAWINEANNEARRLEIIASLPTEQRAAALRNPDSITGNLSRTALYIMLGAVAIFVLPKLLDRK